MVWIQMRGFDWNLGWNGGYDGPGIDGPGIPWSTPRSVRANEKRELGVPMAKGPLNPLLKLI